MDHAGRRDELRSTTTGVDVGFSSEMESVSAAAVEPPGKYHWAEVVVWHGACDQPKEPFTAWVTATPPPDVMTVSDTQEPDASAGTAGVTTPCAGTAATVLAVAPESDVAVMSAVTVLAVVLVKTKKPGDAPPATDWPVQYQADDSASGAPTSALGVGAAATGAGAPRTPTAIATPPTTSTTSAATRQRRSRLTCAGIRTSPSQ
jgi:hypothetical protein